MFANVSNFSEFYSEVSGNNHGMECLRLLNEIICDFDSILDDQQFKIIDKIKTIGTTYMAAIGLMPEHQMNSGPIEFPANVSEETRKEIWQSRKQVAFLLEILIRFVFEMKARLQDINEHSYNCFRMRAGINLGPVTAGVIGASKPQYDIWGNTVNVASRMESTAETNKIQVTQEVYSIVNDFNYEEISDDNNKELSSDNNNKADINNDSATSSADSSCSANDKCQSGGDNNVNNNLAMVPKQQQVASQKSSERPCKFKFTCRGSINVKGKGYMTTYYLEQV